MCYTFVYCTCKCMFCSKFNILSDFCKTLRKGLIEETSYFINNFFSSIGTERWHWSNSSRHRRCQSDWGPACITVWGSRKTRGGKKCKRPSINLRKCGRQVWEEIQRPGSSSDQGCSFPGWTYGRYMFHFDFQFCIVWNYCLFFQANFMVKVLFFVINVFAEKCLHCSLK